MLFNIVSYNLNDGTSKPKNGIKRVKEEALNIVRCVNNGVIPDFKI